MKSSWLSFAYYWRMKIRILLQNWFHPIVLQWANKKKKEKVIHGPPTMKNELVIPYPATLYLGVIFYILLQCVYDTNILFLHIICTKMFIQDFNFRFGIQTKLKLWSLITNYPLVFSNLQTKLSRQPLKIANFSFSE